MRIRIQKSATRAASEAIDMPPVAGWKKGQLSVTVVIVSLQKRGWEAYPARKLCPLQGSRAVRRGQPAVFFAGQLKSSHTSPHPLQGKGTSSCSIGESGFTACTAGDSIFSAFPPSPDHSRYEAIKFLSRVGTGVDVSGQQRWYRTSDSRA